MSEWAEMEEEILEKLGIFYGEDAYVLFSPMQMAAALAEIRRLREECDKANAKAEQYERDWYDAKAEFGQSMKRLRAAGARAMQEKCAGLVQGWPTRMVDGTQAASAIRALIPENE